MADQRAGHSWLVERGSLSKDGRWFRHDDGGFYLFSVATYRHLVTTALICGLGIASCLAVLVWATWRYWL